MKYFNSFLIAVFLAALSPVSAAVADQAIGKPVTFSVTVAGGTLPFTYQWRKNAVAIPAATSESFTIAAVAATDAGVYTCVVTNKAGAVLSDTGTFSITTLPNGITVQITTP